LVTRSSSSFTNPDCRGGKYDYDWIEDPMAWSITGFTLRSVVRKSKELIAYWNAGPSGGYTQGHVRAARFDVSTTTATLMSEPHIWSPDTCFGYPAVSTNARGDIGLSISAGGKAGGGGSPAQGYIGIIDDYSPADLTPGTVYLTAKGLRNRSDGRYGEYYSVRPYSPCDLAWFATNYALRIHPWGPDPIPNVRSIFFARGRDWRCVQEWWNREPA
jgi:hypothetical protein